jgi:hypothetical protein
METSDLLRLSLDPFLKNSTDWWIDNVFQQNDRLLYDKSSDDDWARMQNDYHKWLTEQGVITKDRDYTATFVVPYLEFVDEQSMLMFILRWSN